MNDIILSSLINLFVIFGVKNGLDKEKSRELISSYLMRFYGIRNHKSYSRLFDDLTEYYEEFPELDKTAIVEGICNNLISKILPEEKLTLLLRFLEFIGLQDPSFNPDDNIFHIVADAFSVSEGQYSDMVSFIHGKANRNVLTINLPKDCGELRTLRMTDVKLLVVTYLGPRSMFMDDIRMMPGIFQVWQQSSLIKSNHFNPFYWSTIMSMYDGPTKDQIEFCGRDINFRFKQGGDNGMHNLSFTLHSGELVAVMGGSGVGKSTLLSLLNGTMIPDSGNITINGHDISDPEVGKMIGFVPQDDLLFEELTVYENLWYTAKLCFADLPDEDLKNKVLDVLVQLGLEAAKDLKVGSPVNKFISGGQRKRLNIALELIREPAVLFLDEPTSGLSSTDTEKVVNILKELTNKGKLVIANIHQPSSDVFKLFDRLWLLDKGGYPIYDGNPIESISYFKTIANFADPRTSSCPVCGNVNPEIVLNIIDDKLYDNTGKLTDQRKMSPQEWHEMYLKSRKEMPEPSSSEIPVTDQKRPNRIKQTLIFLGRNVKAKVTNLQYILVTLLEAPILAVICGLLTHYTESGGYTLIANKNFPSYIFMAIIVAIFLGMSGSAEEIIKDKAILKREKFLHLSYGSYIWSKIIYMAGVCLIQTSLFILVGSLVIGVKGMFIIWLAVLFSAAFLSALIGLLLSKTMNSVVAIYITIPLLLIPQILLCGLVVKFDDLNPNSSTGNVPIIGDFIPSRWAYEALAVASFAQNQYERNFFDKDKERYEAMYYDNAFIDQLQTANETRNVKEDAEDQMTLLVNELPYLCRVADIDPYQGDWSYDSIDRYLEDCKTILKDKANKAARVVDSRLSKLCTDLGRENLGAIKKQSFNSQLENLVINRNTESLCKIVDGHIIPTSAYIYLTPRSRNGRSQFYSGVKCLGDKQIDTLYYNLGVLALMCILVAIALFVEFSEKKN